MDPFGALADPTRRRIVELLSEGPRTVSDLTRRVAVSQPAVSKQLKTLRAAGLVAVDVDRNRRWYRVRPEGIAEVAAWLTRYGSMWDSSLDNLARLAARSSKRRMR